MFQEKLEKANATLDQAVEFIADRTEGRH